MGGQARAGVMWVGVAEQTDTRTDDRAGEEKAYRIAYRIARKEAETRKPN